MSTPSKSSKPAVKKEPSYVAVAFYGTPSYYNSDRASWTFNIAEVAYNRINAQIAELETKKCKRFSISPSNVSHPTYFNDKTDAYTISGKVYKVKSRTGKSQYELGKTYLFNGRCTFYDYHDQDEDVMKFGWWLGITGSELKDNLPAIGEVWSPDNVDENAELVDADEDISATPSTGAKRKSTPVKAAVSKKTKVEKPDPKQTKIIQEDPTPNPSRTKRGKKPKKEEEEEYVEEVNATDEE